MERTIRKTTKIAITTLVMFMLLASMVATVLAVDTSALEDRLDPFTGEAYGDLSQYSWLKGMGGYFGSAAGDGAASQHNTDGPAPVKPSILWSLQCAGYGDEDAGWDPLEGDVGDFGPTPMNMTEEIGWVIRAQTGFSEQIPDTFAGGYVLVSSVRGTIAGWGPSFFGAPVPTFNDGYTCWINALDPYDASVVWSTQKTARNNGNERYSYAQTIDAAGEYFRIQTDDGWNIYAVDTGRFVYSVNPAPSGTWFPELQIAVSTQTLENNTGRKLRGYDHSAYLTGSGSGVKTPNNEPIWETQINSAISYLCADTDNKVMFYGSSYDRRVWGINATDGAILWTYVSRGTSRNAVYAGDGKIIHHGLQRTVTCFDSVTGEVLWESEHGLRTFFANSGSTGDGWFFVHAMDTPSGWFGCWDIDTGELLWRIPGYYTIGYFGSSYGDGKVYSILADNRGQGGDEIEAYVYWRDTAGLTSTREMSACIDAMTGEIIWWSPIQFGHNRGAAAGSFRSDDFLAYGCYYMERFCVLYCISDLAGQSWSNFRGSLTQNAVSTDKGPKNLDVPKWSFKTDGPVSATAAIADGRVFIGSMDGKIYCLDAYTGENYWNFTTEAPVQASCAYDGGRVYTGSDDGHVYCLDAENGDVIWTKPTGTWEGSLDWSMADETSQPRSSPIVVGSSVYLGSIDGSIYCLDAGTGAVRWSYRTYGPILGSPMYFNGVVYIASTDINYDRYGRLYAFDAGNGNLKWVTTVTGGNRGTLIGTPIMAEDIPGLGDVIIIGSGGTTWILGFNVTTGEPATFIDGTVFRVRPRDSGGDKHTYPPVYWNGRVYGYGGLFAYCMNVTGGNMTWQDRIIWEQWIVHNPAGAPCLSTSMQGNYLFTSSDGGGIQCTDAVTGEIYSTYQGLGLASSSATIWQGKLYIGHGNHYVYCFDDSPSVPITIWANQDKGDSMWKNETVTISGGVYMQRDFYIPEIEAAGTPAINETYYPPIRNAEVTLIVVKPDGSTMEVSAMADKDGLFTAQFNPNVVGEWSWTAWYAGKEFPLDTMKYSEAYTPYTTFTATDPAATPSNGNGGNGGTTPTEGFPVEYIYVAVAVIVIVVVAVLAYFFLRRR